MHRRAFIALIANQAGDTTAPTVTIAVPANPTNAAAVHTTITFSEDVTGFVVGDITIGGGGSLANFTAVSASIYTVDWTLAAGTNTMDIAAGVCKDAANNDNAAATQLVIYVLGASADVYLDLPDPTSNFGAVNQLWARGTPTSGGRRSLLNFNLTGITSVSYVTLSLFAQSIIPASNTVVARRILPANNVWTEAGATWNTQEGATRWAGDTAGNGGSDAGCGIEGTDYSASALGSIAVVLNDAVGTRYNCALNSTEFAQIIASNQGIVLYQVASDNTFFCSKEHATAGYRPVLTLVAG